MNAIQFDEEAIFYVARKLEDREARDAYLRQVCGGNASLRDRVDALLTVSEQEASFLEAAPYEATVDMPALAESLGTAIGPYKLREQIGEGGMGASSTSPSSIAPRAAEGCPESHQSRHGHQAGRRPLRVRAARPRR